MVKEPPGFLTTSLSICARAVGLYACMLQAGKGNWQEHNRRDNTGYRFAGGEKTKGVSKKQMKHAKMLLAPLVIAIILLFAASSSQAQETAVDTAGTETVLRITSNPEGAEVFINGEPYDGVTPLTIRGLSPGKYLIEVAKARYKKESRNVEVKPGENAVRFSLAETALHYLWKIAPLLVLGAVMTLFLTMISVFNGIVIGIFAGMARVVPARLLNIIAGAYVNFFRGTPLLVQIFMIHFGLPPVLGSLFGDGNPIPLNPFLSAFSALSINSGAYVAEIIRAGIQSIDRGQMEAARSLGMSYWQAMRHVILPQAVKRVIPPLGNEFIAMLKDSSLVSVIGMEELVRKAQVIVTRTYRPTETWLGVGLVFLMMTLPFTKIVTELERRLKTSD